MGRVCESGPCAQGSVGFSQGCDRATEPGHERQTLGPAGQDDRGEKDGGRCETPNGGFGLETEKYIYCTEFY